MPRLQGEHFQKNLGLLERLESFAAKRGAKASQLALAWTLAQGGDIIPIPGTKRVSYLEENVAAAEVTLTPEDLAELDRILPRGATSGDRYSEMAMKVVNL